MKRDVFFSLLIKKVEFNTITKVQQSIVEKAKPEKEPYALFSPLRYNFSEKNVATLYYSPVIKIKINKIGPAK